MITSPLTASHADLKTAIVVHAFYPDIADEIFDRVRSLPARHKLFVTTVPAHEDALRSRLEVSGRDFTLRSFENRGRDLLPFLLIFPQVRAEGFEFVTKLHTKKSPHRLDGDKWRNDLFDKLLGHDSLERALNAFASNHLAGMVGPAGHCVSVSAHMGSNEKHTMAIGVRLGLREQQVREHGFFAGTMFTVRAKALEPLLALSLCAEDFEVEAGQRNGTLAHALERGMALSVSAAGMQLLSSDGVSVEPLAGDYNFARRLNMVQRLRKVLRKMS